MIEIVKEAGFRVTEWVTHKDAHQKTTTFTFERPVEFYASVFPPTLHHGSFMEAFADLVAAREREACVKAAEDEIERIKPVYSVTAENIIKAIKARGKE